MKPTISFHHIETLDLGPIRHFPKDGDTEEFWVRDLIISSDKDKYTTCLFSYRSHEALLTKAELEEEAARRGAVEAAQSEQADAERANTFAAA